MFPTTSQQLNHQSYLIGTNPQALNLYKFLAPLPCQLLLNQIVLKIHNLPKLPLTKEVVMMKTNFLWTLPENEHLGLDEEDMYTEDVPKCPVSTKLSDVDSDYSEEAKTDDEEE